MAFLHHCCSYKSIQIQHEHTKILNYYKLYVRAIIKHITNKVYKKTSILCT